MPKIRIERPSEKTAYLYGLRIFIQKGSEQISIADENIRVACPKGSSIEKFFRRYLK